MSKYLYSQIHLNQYENQGPYMGLVARKPTQLHTSWNLKFYMNQVLLYLFNKQIPIKDAQIRLCRCTGWTACLLFTCNKVKFSCNEAHIVIALIKFKEI